MSLQGGSLSSAPSASVPGSPQNQERLAHEVEREREMARQAKAALDTGAGKIRKLKEGLEAERAARQAAETALAELRIEVATLTERAAHVEELRALIARLRPGGST